MPFLQFLFSKSVGSIEELLWEAGKSLELGTRFVGCVGVQVLHTEAKLSAMWFSKNWATFP